LVLAITIVFNTISWNTAYGTTQANGDEEELMNRIKEIYDCRSKTLITGADFQPIKSFYDLSTKHAQWAFEHEQNKINYMQTWAKKRGVTFTDIKTKIEVKNLSISDTSAKFNVYQSMALNYKYPGQQKAVNQFGVGTIHWVVMKKQDNKWLIQKEFYTDALGDDTLVYRPQPDDGLADVGVNKTVPKSNDKKDQTQAFDRQGAVAYANKYAGLAWGAGNDGKYNNKYKNLFGVGGDCTNFISQCLGDQEGGKLPMDGTWYCRGGNGSLAWVRTVSLAQWLTYSGHATKVTEGTFSQLNQPNEKYPRSAVRELRPGDVIGYEEKGRIQHFAIVTGYDTRGYPVVNAHTTDRFQCPWDIGWDRKTIFHLFKMND
jgi:hypothetical protein